MILGVILLFGIAGIGMAIAAVRAKAGGRESAVLLAVLFVGMAVVIASFYFG